MTSTNRAMALSVFEELGFAGDRGESHLGDEPPAYDAIPEWVNEERVYDEATAVRQDVGLGDWDAGDHTDIPPPREWLLGNQFCRRFLSGVLAPGATGKTALRTLQYLALATGRPLTGQHVFKRSRVLILSLEDDDSELRRRLRFFSSTRPHRR